jgi:glutathione reductase (NADPH)
MKNYDVVVIGAGPAGTAAAYALKEQGKTVAIVEADLWGGTCPNRGCDPKKILMSAVEAQGNGKQLQGKGIRGSLTVDWPELMRFKESYTAQIPTSTKQGLVDAGIASYEGAATFIDEQTLQIGKESLIADQFLIATGQRPSLLAIDGQEHLHTSTDFLSLTELPKKITFIGAGYVAFELAAIALAAGAETHIIHHNQTPLKAFDQELVSDLVRYLQEQGIIFHFDVELESVTSTEQGFLLSGTGFELATDYVVCATGRIPNVETLRLENAEVKYGKHGIQVNDHLQTTNARIFACGDVLDKEQPKLTPVSSFEASFVVQAMTGQKSAIDYPLIPTIVFGSMKLARVGQSEKTLSQTPNTSSKTIDLSSWFTYRRINDQFAKLKIVYSQEGEVLAMTCLSSIADEVINLLYVTLEKQYTLEEIQRFIFAYPTPASDLSYIHSLK